MSTQSINGVGKPRLIVVKETIWSSSSTTFISTGVTIGGAPNLNSLGVRVNQRIASYAVIAGQPNKPVFGKITAIDDVTDFITVDEWVGGTPTNGQTVKGDGWVVDLPRCQDMTEQFTPDVLVHYLWRSRKKAKQYGWIYKCILDYAKYMSADDILAMQQVLNLKPNDKLVLIPRRDNTAFQYNVYYADTVSLSRFGKAGGHKKPVFVFDASEPLASWPLNTGYGTGYAMNYGIQL